MCWEQRRASLQAFSHGPITVVQTFHLLSDGHVTWLHIFPRNHAKFRDLIFLLWYQICPKKRSYKDNICFSRKRIHWYCLQVLKGRECLHTRPYGGHHSPYMQCIHALSMVFVCYWCNFITEISYIQFCLFFIVMLFLQEAFNALGNKVLDKFLKAAEELKNISSDHEKLVVEEKSKDVRKRWEVR